MVKLPGLTSLVLVLLIVTLVLPLAACGGNKGPVAPLDVTDLRGHRIGVLMAWSPDYILEDYGGIDLVRFDGLSDALLALKYRRIEAFAMDTIDAKYLCSVQPGYQMQETPVGMDRYVTFVNNNRTDLLVQFNEFAAGFMNSDEYRDLHERVMNVDNGEFVNNDIPAHTEGPLINVAIDAAAMPYTSYDFASDRYIGSDVEVIQMFAWQYGYRLNFIDSDYNGSVMNLTSGKADLFICALSEAYRFEVELTHKALVSDPYFSTSILLVGMGDRTAMSFDNPDLGY